MLVNNQKIKSGVDKKINMVLLKSCWFILDKENDFSSGRILSKVLLVANKIIFLVLGQEDKKVREWHFFICLLFTHYSALYTKPTMNHLQVEIQSVRRCKKLP